MVTDHIPAIIISRGFQIPSEMKGDSVKNNECCVWKPIKSIKKNSPQAEVLCIL